jgi:hypothetical protein
MLSVFEPKCPYAARDMDMALTKKLKKISKLSRLSCLLSVPPQPRAQVGLSQKSPLAKDKFIQKSLPIQQEVMMQGYSSVVECLPSMCKAQGWIPAPQNKTKAGQY